MYVSVFMLAIAFLTLSLSLSTPISLIIFASLYSHQFAIGFMRVYLYPAHSRHITLTNNIRGTPVTRVNSGGSVVHIPRRTHVGQMPGRGARLDHEFK